MKARRLLTMVVFVMGASVAFDAIATAAARTPIAAVSVGCATGAHSVCVTQSANGHTVTVHVGWTVDVVLHAPDSTWSGPSQLGPRLLRQVGQVRRSVGEVEAVYTAIAVGRTELRALARLTCPASQMCPAFVRVWETHLLVTS